MSNHNHIPTKKFPYLVLDNSSGDAMDDIGSSGNNHDGRRVERRQCGNAHQPRVEKILANQDCAVGQNAGKNPIPTISFRPNLAHYQGPAINLAKMKAILTAQSELRMPVASLYPRASEMSLIPETEEIYKKYFPSDEDISIMSLKKGQGLDNTAAVQSSSDSSITRRKEIIQQKPVAAQFPLVVDNRNGNSIQGLSVDVDVTTDFPYTNDKQTGRQCKDTEVKFRKRLQSQYLSLTTELERQSAELSDLRKEVKDLREATRKTSTSQDGARSRIDTLSKHVQEIDSKMDTLQDMVSNQEKSLLNKLMMIADMSDSDSDGDDSSNSAKFLDPIRSVSFTKLAGLSARGKRPGSANATSAPSTSTSPVTDTLPKVCSNWIPIAPDFDKLIQAVAVLNYRMDRNQSMKLCTTNSGATFKHSDVIDLTIYKNGLILGSSGFRSYSTMSVIKLVNEIFNGYLPMELTTQYPDGVVIVLCDKRSKTHAIDLSFSGSGLKLKKEDLEIPELFPGKDGNNFQKRKGRSTADSTPITCTTSQISVSTSTVSSSNDCDDLPDLIVEVSEGSLPGKVIRLKISDLKNGRKYRLRVPINCAVKRLTDHLGEVLEEREDIISAILKYGVEGATNRKLFDIVLPVPYGKLACPSATLEEYGIIQNTHICIQERRP